jgi:hypothetical protein
MNIGERKSRMEALLSAARLICEKTNNQHAWLLLNFATANMKLASLNGISIVATENAVVEGESFWLLPLLPSDRKRLGNHMRDWAYDSEQKVLHTSENSGGDIMDGVFMLHELNHAWKYLTNGTSSTNETPKEYAKEELRVYSFEGELLRIVVGNLYSGILEDMRGHLEAHYQGNEIKNQRILHMKWRSDESSFLPDPFLAAPPQEAGNLLLCLKIQGCLAYYEHYFPNDPDKKLAFMERVLRAYNT